MYANIAWTVLSPLPLGTPQNSIPQAGVHAALPNSTIIPVSAGSQCWPSPHVAIDLEKVALLVRETNLALLVETSFLEIVCKPAIVSIVFRRKVSWCNTYFSLSTLGSSMTLSVRLSASQQ